jgi:hypothetical protein
MTGPASSTGPAASRARSGLTATGIALGVLSAGTFGTSGIAGSALIGSGWSPDAVAVARPATTRCRCRGPLAKRPSEYFQDNIMINHDRRTIACGPSGLVTLTRPYSDRRSCYGLPLRQRVLRISQRVTAPSCERRGSQSEPRLQSVLDHLVRFEPWPLTKASVRQGRDGRDSTDEVRRQEVGDLGQVVD